jgi:hypothetical protein
MQDVIENETGKLRVDIDIYGAPMTLHLILI